MAEDRYLSQLEADPTQESFWVLSLSCSNRDACTIVCGGRQSRGCRSSSLLVCRKEATRGPQATQGTVAGQGRGWASKTSFRPKPWCKTPVRPWLASLFPTHNHPRRHKKKTTGLPWWFNGKESACQCRRHGFKPWSGKIPHAAEQLSPCTTTVEPVKKLEPRSHNCWRPRALELVPCNWSVVPARH